MCVRVRACVNATPNVKCNTGGYCVCVCDDTPPGGLSPVPACCYPRPREVNREGDVC